jgi:hypothetical protein
MPRYEKKGNPDKPGLTQRLRSRIKLAIMWLAVRDKLPTRVTEWLIQRGGLKHD